MLLEWSGGGVCLGGGEKVSFDSRIFKPFSDQKKQSTLAINHSPLFTFFRPYFLKKPQSTFSSNPILSSPFRCFPKYSIHLQKQTSPVAASFETASGSSSNSRNGY